MAPVRTQRAHHIGVKAEATHTQDSHSSRKTTLSSLLDMFDNEVSAGSPPIPHVPDSAATQPTQGVAAKVAASLAVAASRMKGRPAPPESTASTEPIKEEIKTRVADVIDKEVQKAAEEHRQPTKQELDDAVEDELDRIWWTLMRAHRHQWHPAADRPTGIVNFFESVQFYDWCLLFIAFIAFLLLYRYLLDWPSTKTFHSVALLIWIALAAVYNFLIFGRLGARRGAMWSNGYLLEFIFLIENVFVFHIIVKAFRMPRYVTQKAIFIVVVCQIVFQMVFYMGLASWLRSFEILPYILGVWLLYVGYQSAAEDDHEFNIMESKVVLGCKALLGDRLLLKGREENEDDFNHDEQCAVLVKSPSGKTCLSKMGLMVICLLLADFLLEIDVTLTKIETFPNQYICFSSSVVASFAVPELFFVARDLFRQFFGLKYGISFVLVFFGMQMLLHDVFTLPALVCIMILVTAIVLSIVVSVLMQWGTGDNSSPSSTARATLPEKEQND